MHCLLAAAADTWFEGAGRQPAVAALLFGTCRHTVHAGPGVQERKKLALMTAGGGEPNQVFGAG